MKPTRRISPLGTYFITSATWQRRPIFVVGNAAQLFLKTLFHYREQGCYRLHTFVLMPDHIHLLITPVMDTTLERAVQLIKGGSAHMVGEDRGRGKSVWERGFADHRIRDAEDFEVHRNYILANPLKAGLVERPCDYPYCSAFPGFTLDPWPAAAKAAISWAV